MSPYDHGDDSQDEKGDVCPDKRFFGFSFLQRDLLPEEIRNVDNERDQKCNGFMRGKRQITQEEDENQ